MKAIVWCEKSQRVAKALCEAGVDARSCDILPCEHPEWGIPHIQDDALNHLTGYDLAIGHPPCTHLSKAGGWCWKYKEREQLEAFRFVLRLWEAPIQRIAIENPIGWLNTHWMPPSQIIHPYYFGDPYLKETCLWLKNLPLLTYVLQDDMFYKATAVEPIANWVKPGNIRNRRFNRVPEGGNRNSKDRSRMFPKVAEAMATQWSTFGEASNKSGGEL